MSILRHARVFAVLAPLYGCIVVVSPFDVGEHCGIAGDSACAECLRKTCQTSIDACCKSTTCSGATVAPILDVVDECGRGDKDACISSVSVARVAAEDEAVRSCVATQCKAECVEGGVPKGPSTKPTWSCATPREPSTACAKCIYDECSTSLEECCADSSCHNDSSIAKDMGACVSGDAPGCAYSQTGPRSTSGVSGVVRACIQKNCGTTCFGDGVTHQSCNLQSGGSYCTCSNSEESSGPECSAAKVGGRCVLTAAGCICGEYSCSGSGDCSCDFRSREGSTSCVPRTEESECCLKVTDSDVTCSCEKYGGSCEGRGYYGIDTCTQANVFMMLKELFVDVCSR